MSNPDNPPAFPSRRYRPMPGGGAYRDDLPGMTLRDWFAGQALAGLLHGQYAHSGIHNLGEVPREAYDIADAMLAARPEQPK